MQNHPLQDCATAGAPQRAIFCCAGYTPEVLAVLRRLRLDGREPLTRDACGERSLSLDGVTTACRYIRLDDGIPASFYDVLPKSPCWNYMLQ